MYSTFKLYPPSDGVSKYRVLLEQTKEDRSNTFLLYESAQFEDAQEQFAKIHKTLKPLVEDGVVMLSNYLLTMFDFEDTELTPSEVSLYTCVVHACTKLTQPWSPQFQTFLSLPTKGCIKVVGK